MINKSTVKYIQSLQDKKFRDLHGAFIAEGPKVVIELLEDGSFECESVFLSEQADPAIVFKALAGKVPPVTGVTEFELQKMSALQTANNVIAVFRKKLIPASVNFSGNLTLVLDDLQDPGNLGTIIRIADWFGVTNILCSLRTADFYGPKVVQSTMASLARVNILYGDLLELLRGANGILKFAAVLGGRDVRTVSKVPEAILMIGNESKGLSAQLIAAADQEISVMKTGKAESLNAAVAAGIILFQLRG